MQYVSVIKAVRKLANNLNECCGTGYLQCGVTKHSQIALCDEVLVKLFDVVDYYVQTNDTDGTSSFHFKIDTMQSYAIVLDKGNAIPNHTPLSTLGLDTLVNAYRNIQLLKK